MKKKIFGLILLLAVSFPACVQAYQKRSTAGISHINLLKKYKNINFISSAKLKRDSAKLTQEDKYVLIKYVQGAVKGENTFLLINSYLRDDLHKYINQKDINKPLKSRLKFYADSLDKTLTKTKLPLNAILYYSADEKQADTLFSNKELNGVINSSVNENNLAVLKNKLLNKTFTEKGFLLTSYEKEKLKREKFVFIINAPQNLQAVLIDEILKNNNKQVLINSGYTWKVTGVEYYWDYKQPCYVITLKLVLN